MPLYEYRCEACGAGEEAIESFSAPTEHACPACGAALGMKRQLSASGFVLSGGGWYASGYGQGGAKTEGKAAGDKAGAGAAPKAEAAPAAPTPASGCGGACSCH